MPVVLPADVGAAIEPEPTRAEREAIRQALLLTSTSVPPADPWWREGLEEHLDAGPEPAGAVDA
ncbi:MAG: hypothetical protein ACE5EV_01025 [Gaiellales bacterium]